MDQSPRGDKGRIPDIIVMKGVPMDDIGAMHSEIERLRALARINTDARVHAAIEVLIRELRDRIERAEKDHARGRQKREQHPR
jgi:hypothetical protein